ncbi:MAG: TlyA family RNA methyltransferase [Polyangiaceae bacterium]|nr:TlyA family RNA methyltransferase [Polyangiaceae bacterium]MCW5790301.1 TlyA family RNA methyltransferase [Polyangiaceae bacterium]
MKKTRVDVLLVERGLAPSRARAQAYIMAGRVFHVEQRVDKPGLALPSDAALSVRGLERFVSRGGYKLEGALDAFRAQLDPEGLTVVDIGASTGGFTDCLLQRGAARVYAVDVGEGQLAQQLANDPRVVVRDRTNARFLAESDFPEPIDLITIDASFIGLSKLAPAARSTLRPGGHLLAMVKPQFEVGREAARQHQGVIRDPELRSAAISNATESLTTVGFEILASVDSTLPGPKGNLERFVLARRP